MRRLLRLSLILIMGLLVLAQPALLGEAQNATPASITVGPSSSGPASPGPFSSV